MTRLRESKPAVRRRRRRRRAAADPLPPSSGPGATASHVLYGPCLRATACGTTSPDPRAQRRVAAPTRRRRGGPDAMGGRTMGGVHGSRHVPQPHAWPLALCRLCVALSL